MNLAEAWQSMPDHMLRFAQTYGEFAYLAGALMLALRTGLLIGGAIPGGSMVFALGVVAAYSPKGWIGGAILGLALASTVGSGMGYSVAKWASTHPKAPNWMRPNPSLLERTAGLYTKLGFGATIFAVSQPWMCSISPFLAVKLGLGGTRYLIGSAIGSLLWVAIIFSLGWGTGSVGHG